MAIWTNQSACKSIYNVIGQASNSVTNQIYGNLFWFDRTQTQTLRSQIVQKQINVTVKKNTLVNFPLLRLEDIKNSMQKNGMLS